MREDEKYGLQNRIATVCIQREVPMNYRLMAIILLSAVTVMLSGLPALSEENVVELKKEIETLKKRVAELEASQTRPVVGISRSTHNPANLNAIDPFADIRHMQEEMDRAFQKHPGQDIVAATGLEVAIDFKETPEHYIVTLNTSGLDQEKIEVRINEKTVTVKGEQSRQNQQQNPQGYFQSQSYGSFMKTFSVPGDVDAQKIETEKNGDKLIITMPKKTP